MNKKQKQRPFWFCKLLDERYDCEDENTTCKKCAEELLEDIKEYLNRDILDEIIDEF